MLQSKWSWIRGCEAAEMPAGYDAESEGLGRIRTMAQLVKVSCSPFERGGFVSRDKGFAERTLAALPAYCTVFLGQSLLPMLAPDRKTVYGITYPDAEFFSCDLATGTFKRLGKWLENLSYPGPERSWRESDESAVSSFSP